MEDIIKTIQQDILDPNMSLVNILLKAKVLAYQLNNDELKWWVKNELDGYGDIENVPDYRNFVVPSIGTLANGAWIQKNVSIPMFPVSDDFRAMVEHINIHGDISSIEERAKQDELRSAWPGDWIALYNYFVDEQLEGFYLINAYRPFSSSQFAQIMQTVRSRLQDFILELSDLPWQMAREPQVRDQIERLVAVAIYNNAQGGNVTTFDQRGQQVTYQYNAAGNMNFGAVQNRVDFIGELEKLKTEFDRAKDANIIDAEVVTDAKYQIDKAIIQANKPQADQKTILEHINGAKTLIESVSAASGLVTGLITAADLVQKFFA